MADFFGHDIAFLVLAHVDVRDEVTVGMHERCARDGLIAARRKDHNVTRLRPECRCLEGRFDLRLCALAKIFVPIAPTMIMSQKPTRRL